MSSNTPSGRTPVRAPTFNPRRLVAGGTLAAALAIGLVVAARAPVAATAPSASAAVTAVSPRQGFADLVERVQPAVVNVATVSRVESASAPMTPFGVPEGQQLPEQFRKFFERRFPGGEAPEARGVGSGFFVDARGHVVTNYHVVKDADEIVVTLNDGTEIPAKVVGHDEKTDLAVLEVERGSSVPFVEFGDSDQARVGDWVVAVGSPFGLGGTVTAGIISARGRDIHSGPFDDYLQVDAPINRGNSGGPLFDQSGRVIGVNTAIYSPSGGNVGIGFAIPAGIASGVVQALISDGQVKRGWMGVSIQGMTPELAESFGLDKPRGALVASVIAGSPAESAGITVGDVIVRFDGKPIESMRELPRAVADAKAGATVDVVVLREGKERSLTMRVGDMPDADQVASIGTDDEATAEPTRLGVRLAEIDPAARERLGLSAGTDGVLIAEVAPGGAAARQGLRPGDVILRVGKDPVKRPAQVADAVREADRTERSGVVLLVSRNGNERFVAVPFGRG